MQRLIILITASLGLMLFASCRSTEAGGHDNSGLEVSRTRPFDPKLAPMRLHTEGTKMLDANGKPVWLCGVNIASLEWRNDGDHVEESVNRAITEWKVNLIRLPLAQDRWFGKMTNPTNSAAAYRAIVDKLVGICAASRVYIDLELHWSECGQWVNEGGRLGQHVMPDRHSVDFWHDVATRYKNHPNVIFGLYNEPHDAPWNVWRDGGTITDSPAQRARDQTRTTYQAVGMQNLYDAVRSTGAKNLVTISGLDWGYDLSGVLKGYAIKGRDFVYETHPYANKPDWDKSFGVVSERYPVYVGEWGFSGNRTNNLDYAHKLMEYVRQHNLHWTAWDFHVSAGPTLIRNWSYEPTVFGQIVKEQLANAEAARNSSH
jgi:endoglucanase